jgi:hypothetical protein
MIFCVRITVFDIDLSAYFLNSFGIVLGRYKYSPY